MSYSGWLGARAMALSLSLLGCARDVPVHGANDAAAYASAGGSSLRGAETARDGRAVRLKRLRAAHLAYEAREARMQESSRPVLIVEHRGCDLDASELSARCDLSQMVNESMASGVFGIGR